MNRSMIDGQMHACMHECMDGQKWTEMNGLGVEKCTVQELAFFQTSWLFG